MHLESYHHSAAPLAVPMPRGSSTVTALSTSFATYFRAEPSPGVSAEKFKSAKEN